MCVNFFFNSFDYVFLVKNLLLKIYYFRKYKMKKNMSKETIVIFWKNIWYMNLINKEIWIPFIELKSAEQGFLLQCPGLLPCSARGMKT